MKVSLEWIKNYVNISGLSPQEIAGRLTLAGLEVEAVHTTEAVPGICVAKVEEMSKHPDADKLNVCKVYDGNENFQVVCGAPNVQAGQTIVFSKIGAVLPGSFKIKEATIRGVKSYGMICSERELGISEEHDGIIVLSDGNDLGGDANPVLGLGDTILEIGITPNRGDCLSVYGVAREISAIFDIGLRFMPFAVNETDPEVSTVSSVMVEDFEACPFYSARIIKGVKVGPSPQWMQNRIKSAGMRPVNNVVDVTNYVMLEYGQPMHGFDLSVIEKGIVVRRAKNGEEIVTLDGKKRMLDDSVTVIADHKKILGLAGVMGGEFSGINDNTVDIMLECAYFKPSAVAATSKKFGIASDSAYRYARGVDGGRSRTLLDYAASLLADICGGKVLAGALTAGFEPAKVHTVNAKLSSINELIGQSLSMTEVTDILSRLGMATVVSGHHIAVSVPSHRSDVTHGAAVTEEVARLYGFDKIPSVLPSFSSDGVPHPAVLDRRMTLRHRLSSLGFTEMVNYSFMSEMYLLMFCGLQKLVPIINPLSEEMNTLRPFIFPSLLKSLETNWNQGERAARIFEMSTVFTKAKGSDVPNEAIHLCFAVMGDYTPLSWTNSNSAADSFYYLKGICENIFSTLRINAEYMPSDISWLHPGKSAEIFLNGVNLGFLGAMHPDVSEKLDLKSPIYIAELDFDKLCEMAADKNLQYKPFSRYPSVSKDINLVAPNAVQAADISKLIHNISPLVQDVILYDLYSGEGIDAAVEKSLTYRIIFASLDKTLTDEEINPLLAKIAAAAGIEYKAKLR